MTTTDRDLDALLGSAPFREDPYPVYSFLRDRFPVFWSETWGVWVVTRHEDVEAILRDHRRFSSQGRFNAFLEQLTPEEQAPLGPLRRFGEAAYNLDPPAHAELRGLTRGAFLAASIAALRPTVQRLVDELLDAAERRGRLELVEDLARPLPVLVVADLLGLTLEEAEPFGSWADEVLKMLADGGAVAETAARAASAMAVMEARLASAVVSRRSRPRGDLLTRLVRSGALTDGDISLVAVELMVAGHHTTKDLIGNAVITLLRHPPELARVRADWRLLPSTIDEVLRFESPIQRGWRRVIERVTLHGHELSPGQLVFVMIGSANRDPARFPEPDRFDPTRPEDRHVAFGQGIHFCIGAPLARMEAAIALAALLLRYPRLALGSESIDWYGSIHIRGPRRLLLAT